MRTARARSPEIQTDTNDHTTKVLLLNCMDHRLVDNVTRYMDSRSMRDRDDQITLAGAAIGVLAEEKSAWGETFWDHVGLARELHNIEKIIVINHRYCGARKAFVTPECGQDPEAEMKLHTVMLNRLAKEIRSREPGLEVELLLMNLDGTVQHILIDNEAVPLNPQCAPNIA